MSMYYTGWRIQIFKWQFYVKTVQSSGQSESNAGKRGNTEPGSTVKCKMKGKKMNLKVKNSTV